MNNVFIGLVVLTMFIECLAMTRLAQAIIASRYSNQITERELQLRFFVCYFGVVVMSLNSFLILMLFSVKG